MNPTTAAPTVAPSTAPPSPPPILPSQPAPAVIKADTPQKTREGCSNCRIPIPTPAPAPSSQSAGPNEQPDNRATNDVQRQKGQVGQRQDFASNGGGDMSQGQVSQGQDDQQNNQGEQNNQGTQQNHGSDDASQGQGDSFDTPQDHEGQVPVPDDHLNPSENDIPAGPSVSENSESSPQSSNGDNQTPDLNNRVHTETNEVNTHDAPSPVTIEKMQEILGDILYKFNYTVGYHGHHEQGDRSGAKEGGYFTIGRDGLKRTVNYKANENGYQPYFKIERVAPEEVPEPETEKENKRHDYEFKWFFKNDE